MPTFIFLPVKSQIIARNQLEWTQGGTMDIYSGAKANFVLFQNG